MFFRLVADLVVVAHFTFIMFIAAGGMLAWRWPRLVWVHLPAFVYGAAIIGIGFTCPLTPLEKYFRRLGGESPYQGGFIDHYIKGDLYPAHLNALAQSLVAAAVVVGYAGLVRRRRAPGGRRSTQASGPAPAGGPSTGRSPVDRASHRRSTAGSVFPRVASGSRTGCGGPGTAAAGRARHSLYSPRRRQPATAPSPPSGRSARPSPAGGDEFMTTGPRAANAGTGRSSTRARPRTWGDRPG